MHDTTEEAVFPEGLSGCIPAFKVVELLLNPLHNQSTGYGLKIAKITPQGHTLFSYLNLPGHSL
jgi:hypothetical protein